MNILIQPSSLSLVGSMNHVVINTEKEVSFVLNDSGGNAIVKHLYVPSDTNRIEVDLKNIILPLLTFKLQDVSSPYQQSGIVKSFSATITETGDGGETKTFSFTVIRAGVDHFDGDSSSFLTQNFLTWQPNVKPVTYYTPEFLTYYAVVATTIRCKAYFEDDTTQTIALAQIAAGECWTVPVQYAVIAGKVGNKLPQYYEVWAENASGSRLTYIQRYVASDMRSEEEEWILFENSLGGIDTFQAYGDSENTAKHTHNVAEIEDDFEEYRVDTTREHKKNTGYLGNRERVWLLDFFPSTGKYVYTDNFIRRIVVTESDVSYNAKELPSNYNFTYKYADARPYLNLPRAELPQKVLNIKIPDLGSFTVAPRLAEFPRLTLSGGALFPVENPYSEQWTVTTAAAILEYIINGIAANYTGNGGIGHTHPNINLLNTIRLAEDYLLANGNKIKAGFADEAKDLSEDSSIWNKFLRKDKEDTANKLITFLEGLASKDFAVFHKGLKTATYDGDNSLNGHGAMVDEDGNGVFQSIFARNFISAPKFVFNEINVTKAEQWNTNAYGTIESVDTSKMEITLHLEENEYGSVEVGDICRGIFADLGNIYGTDTNEDGTLDDCNFVIRKGFFTTYFCVEKIITNERGKCIFQYRKRNSSTPDPCAFMDFAQYGSFIDKNRQSSMYMSSKGRSYIEVLDGVNNWEIRPQNRVCRYGWLGNLTIEKDDGTKETLKGNGLFAQNNVYFGNDIIKLSNISDLDDLQKIAGAYDVTLSRYQGVITVDDMGNVIGGLYTLSSNGAKQYSLSTAVYVRKGNDILLEADDTVENVTEGYYRVTAFSDDCTVEVKNSAIYVKAIHNIRDGVSDTEEDIDFDAMRKAGNCKVTIVVDLEGKIAKTIEFPIRIVHDPLPFLDCDIDNEHSSVSWNTKANRYTGFPVKTVASLMYHNEPWQVDLDSHVDGLPEGLKADVSFPEGESNDAKKMVISIDIDGTKTGDFLAKKEGDVTATKHNISIHIIGTYAGARYEYGKLLTIDRLADTTVYELIPSSDSIVLDGEKKLSADSLTCEVWATSSDDKHYKVEDLVAAGLEIKYCKEDGTPDIAYGTSVSVSANDKIITFGLFDKATGDILDKEAVPVVAWGEDGKGVEFIYFRSEDAQTVFDNYKPDEWYADSKYQSADEYIAEIQKNYPGWTDDPQGISEKYPYEYVSVRKTTNGVWGKFSKPAVFATMARSVKNVNTFYAIVEQGQAGTKPDDNKFTHDNLTDVVISDNKGKWLWSADKVTYYDGSHVYLNKTCLGNCEDMANVVEQYGVSNDPSVSPAAPYDASGTYPGNLSEGDCIWSRDHIVWLNNTTTDTEWQFIGRIGGSGRGITKTEIKYARSNDGEKHPALSDTAWQDEMPDLDDDFPWLWIWTRYHYSKEPLTEDVFTKSKMGIDGNGVENIYIRVKDAQAALDAYHPAEWAQKDGYQSADGTEFVPTSDGWTDNPQGVNAAWPYEYVSVRKRGKNGVWGDFSTPAVAYVHPRIITRVNTFYAIAGEGERPSDSAFTFDDLSKVVIPSYDGKWVWSADKVTYNSGDSSQETTEFLNKTSLGACKDLASVTEQYGISSDTSDWPIGAYMNSAGEYSYPDNLDEGDCIWSRDRIVWLDGNISYTAWQFIGKNGGRGISSTTVLYAVNDSGTSHPNIVEHPERGEDSIWKYNPPLQTASKPFLWTWTHIDYTDGTYSNSFSVSRKGQSTIKSTVFCRTNNTPLAPSGGSYSMPSSVTGNGTSEDTSENVEWSDGIPSGSAIVWASTRIFTDDSLSPQQSAWTTPRQMTDTADFDVCYHDGNTQPQDNPTSHHTEDQGNGWYNTPAPSAVWMATDVMRNGIWQGWQVSKIKGEDGVATAYEIDCSALAPNVTNGDVEVTFTAYKVEGTTRNRMILGSNGFRFKYGSTNYYQNPLTLKAPKGSASAITVTLEDSDGNIYRTCTVSPVTDGDAGKPATYYEARFAEQNISVYVDKGYETGYVSAMIAGSFYLVQGDVATKASGSGLGLTLEFLNDSGDAVVKKTASVDGASFSYSSSSKTEIQSDYRNQDSNKITSCRYTVTCTDGKDTKSGVIPVGFNAGSVFYHTDERFESLLQDKNGAFSELTQTVDGIYTHVQRLETNMFMGTTTGLGWTLEKTCEKNSYVFSSVNRQFSIYNFYPAFASGYKGKTDVAAYSTLRSPIVRVEQGRRYIISFQASMDVGVKGFIVGIRYGSATNCNQNPLYFYWNSKVANSNKAEDIIVQSKSDRNRYFVIFTAASGYDYLQILFINSVDGSSYKSTTKVTESELTEVPAAWPYSEESKSYHYGTDSVTVTEDNTVQTTVGNYARYGGTDDGPYYIYTKTEEVRVNSASLYIIKPQLELAFNESIADIEPSEYKEAQNAIESYIKQTADCIELNASLIHLEGYTTINNGFSIDKNGNATMNDAIVNGTFMTGSGDTQIVISAKEKIGGITLGNFLDIGYNKETSRSFGSLIADIEGIADTGGHVIVTSKGKGEFFGQFTQTYQTKITGLTLQTNFLFANSIWAGSLRLSTLTSSSFNSIMKQYVDYNLCSCIVMTNSSSTTVYLPQNPLPGQIFIVIQGNASLTINGNGNKIWSRGGSKDAVSSGTTGEYNIFFYDPLNWQWIATYVNNSF